MVNGESVEAAWARLRRHLDRANAFWLGFVFATELHGASKLAERAEWNRRRHAAPFLLIQPSTPGELVVLVDRLETEAPGPPGCTWIEAAHVGTDLVDGGSWAEAWTTFLQSLNHRRDTLRRRLGGLVLVAPLAAKRTAMTVSTDLWSVRDYLTELTSTAADDVVGSASSLRGTGEVGPDRSTAPLPGLDGAFIGGERSEADQAELLALLAAADTDLQGPWRGRLAAAIESALIRPDDPAASVLLLRRGSVRMVDDPAGARDDLLVAADRASGDRARLVALGVLFELAMQAAAIEDARGFATRSLEIAERLAEQVGTPEALRDLSVSLDNLGRVHEARGEWEPATGTLQRSVEILEDMIRREVTAPADIDNVAMLQERLAVIASQRSGSG